MFDPSVEAALDRLYAAYHEYLERSYPCCLNARHRADAPDLELYTDPGERARCANARPSQHGEEAMPFGFTGGGDITPRVKFNAKSGRAYRVDRAQDEKGEWQSEDIDITDHLTFLADRQSLRQGWINFTDFDRVLVPIDQDLPKQPSDAHKPYVTLRIRLSKDAGGDVREFATSALCVMDALEKLVHNWSRGKEAADPEVCPVVELAGVTADKGKHGTNYIPEFKVVGWKPRPDDFPPVEEAAQAEGEPVGAAAGGEEAKDIPF